MCCGQKRATLTQGNTSRTSQPAPQAPSPPAALPKNNARNGGAPAAASSVALRYLQTSPIRVRGSVTGNQYEFSAASPVSAVDVRDTEALLRARFFAKAG